MIYILIYDIYLNFIKYNYNILYMIITIIIFFFLVKIRKLILYVSFVYNIIIFFIEKKFFGKF